jgi:hypothetical protein
MFGREPVFILIFCADADLQLPCAPSAGGSTLLFPSLSIREKKRTPHLV